MLTDDEIDFLMAAVDCYNRHEGLKVSGMSYSMAVKLQQMKGGVDSPSPEEPPPKARPRGKK